MRTPDPDAGSRDGRARHQQIAADLRARIMSGEFEPGTQLPSTVHLVARYDAANATVQRALSALKDEGFVVGRAGKGVYVRDRPPFVVQVAAFLVPDPGGYRYEILDVADVALETEVARGLGVAAGAPAVLRHRLLFHDGEPVELSWSYYPADIAGDGPLTGRGRIRGGAPRVLTDLGLAPRSFVDRVSVRPPTSEEVNRLALPADVPVLRQFRVVYAADDRPVEASILVKGGHRYELLYRQTLPGPR